MVTYMTYRGYIIEWFDSRNAYCVYKQDAPDRAVCWGDTLLAAQIEVDYIVRRAARRRKAART